jgi:hypothetical protein
MSAMSATKRDLADGLYEEVVTRELEQAIDALRERRFVQLGQLEPAAAHVALARYLGAEIERVLGDLKGDDRLDRQIELSNALLAVLIERGLLPSSQLLVPPGRELLALHADERTVPTRPRVPLSMSNLLTLGPSEPKIGHELRAELDSADRVDALISFVTTTGVRFLFDAIERMTRGQRGRSSSSPDYPAWRSRCRTTSIEPGSTRRRGSSIVLRACRRPTSARRTSLTPP